MLDGKTVRLKVEELFKKDKSMYGRGYVKRVEIFISVYTELG